MTDNRRITRSTTKAVIRRSPRTSPSKQSNSFDKSPDKVSPTRRNAKLSTGRVRDTTVKKKKAIGSTEMSRSPVKPHKGKQELPIKRPEPSEMLAACDRLSADLEEIVSPMRLGGSPIKRQKLDGQPFDLKIARHERHASSQSKRHHSPLELIK